MSKRQPRKQITKVTLPSIQLGTEVQPPTSITTSTNQSTSNSVTTSATMSTSNSSLSLDPYHPSDSNDRLLPHAESSEAFIDASKQLTPEIIEAEFKNILTIHSRKDNNVNESLFPNAILQHRTHRNGSFAKTVIFREIDDTYIGFPHQTILISSTNLTKFWFYYEKFKTEHNIVLDSRLQLLIMYATIAYADELIVYNAFTTRVVNLYDYCSDLFKITASELNIRQIQELFIMKMIISYYLYEQNIPWQVNQIMNNLKELHTYSTIGASKKTIIDIMINYIRCGSVNNFDRGNVEKLFKRFHDYFSTKAYSLSQHGHDVIISKWTIHNLTIEDVYVTFMLLKEANFTFIKNDNM